MAARNSALERKLSRVCVDRGNPLGWVSYISETISETTVEDADPCWIREKLSPWLEHKSVAEISIGSVNRLLKSGANFDTQMDSQNGPHSLKESSAIRVCTQGRRSQGDGLCNGDMQLEVPCPSFGGRGSWIPLGQVAWVQPSSLSPTKHENQ